MKKVYICGDSFGSVDFDYPGFSWSERLAILLNGQAELVNLSQVCASNLLINLQVDQAIKDADYVICLATAVSRAEAKINKYLGNTNLINRFHPFTTPSNNDLVSYSIPTASNGPFTTAQLELINKYHAEFFDLELEIYRNRCIIENTLQKLVDSNIPFLFDQGGFENPQFANSSQTYFEKYKRYASDINLWNYAKVRTLRPYFHILDASVHQHVANYYYQKITNA